MRKKTIRIIILAVAIVVIGGFSFYGILSSISIPVIKNPDEISDLLINYNAPSNGNRVNTEPIENFEKDSVIEYLSTCSMKWKKLGSSHYQTGLYELQVIIGVSTGSPTQFAILYFGEKHMLVSFGTFGSIYEVIDGNRVFQELMTMLEL